MEEIRGNNALILGYGKEGQSTHRFLEKHFPGLRVDVADQKDGKGYLSRLKDYDTVIRSPGIPAATRALATYTKKRRRGAECQEYIFFFFFKRNHRSAWHYR